MAMSGQGRSQRGLRATVGDLDHGHIVRREALDIHSFSVVFAAKEGVFTLSLRAVVSNASARLAGLAEQSWQDSRASGYQG